MAMIAPTAPYWTILLEFKSSGAKHMKGSRRALELARSLPHNNNIERDTS